MTLNSPFSFKQSFVNGKNTWLWTHSLRHRKIGSLQNNSQQPSFIWEWFFLFGKNKITFRTSTNEMCLYFSHKDNSEREQLLSELLLPKKEAKVWCVWLVFSWDAKKQLKKKQEREKNSLSFIHTKTIKICPSNFLFFPKWIIISQKKKETWKTETGSEKTTQENLFAVVLEGEKFDSSLKKPHQTLVIPFHSVGTFTVELCDLEEQSMSEHNTLTHTKKDVMNCCEDNLSHHGKRMRKKTRISWWNLSIFPVTKKILERKRHPKSPNSMLFLSIQIFPPNGEHLHHKSDTVETMIWRGSKPVSWCRQAKQTHQGKLFEENCFNLTTWKKKPSSITELSDVLLFDPRLFDFCKFVQNCLKKHASTPKLCDFCLPSQKICGIYSTFLLGVKKIWDTLSTLSEISEKKILGRDETGCQVKKNFSCCTQWIHNCFFLQIVLISLWNCGTSDVFVIQFNFTSCRKHLFVVPSFTSHAVILAFNKFLHLLCSFQLFSFLILSPITRTYFLFHSQRTHWSTGVGVSDTQNRCSALSELARDQIITNKPCLQHHWNANCDHDLCNHWFVQSWRERFRFECFVLSRETTKQTTKNTSFLSFPLPPMADLKPCYPKQYLPTHLTRKEELSIGSASSQCSCSQLPFCVSTSHFSAKREAVETKNGCLKLLFWWMAWKWRLMNAINILDMPYLWLAYFNAKDNFPLCLFLLRCA